MNVFSTHCAVLRYPKIHESTMHPQQIFVSKGQIISKRFFSDQGFFQKTNENTLHTNKNEFIRSFFGRILGQKKKRFEII